MSEGHDDHDRNNAQASDDEDDNAKEDELSWMVDTLADIMV